MTTSEFVSWSCTLRNGVEQHGAVEPLFASEFDDNSRCAGLLSTTEYAAWGAARAARLLDAHRRRELAVVGVAPIERKRRGPSPRAWRAA